jgi:asparagine synthase (glutamine-hydrolysing)
VAEARYWSMPDGIDKLRLSREEAVDGLGWLLGRSVALQLRSDVPVGCQLSGGVDSSLIAVLARAHQDADLKAFSIVFSERPFSEEPWILAAAAAAGAASHRFVFDEAAFMGALDAASWHMDQPISHPNALALWLLARHAREHATVLLSGEGADELFGGYRRFADAQTAAEASGSDAHDPIDAFIRASQFHTHARLSKLRPTANLQPAIDKRRTLFEQGRGDHLSNCVRYEMGSHLVDLLGRQDKMMMAHGVENRVPFLDQRVIEFARALPAEHLVGPSSPTGARVTKRVVKDLARRSFDAAFVDRRKSAFNLPLAQYFRSRRFVALMEERLLPGMAARGLVDVAVVRRWWRRALSAPSTTEAFWIPVALELWAQQFIDGRGYPS